jgi:hypothetical protein
MPLAPPPVSNSPSTFLNADEIVHPLFDRASLNIAYFLPNQKNNNEKFGH